MKVYQWNNAHIFAYAEWLKEEERSKNTIEKYLRDVRAPVTVNAKQLARPYK